MTKFAHIADSHLGGWRNPKIQDLNLQSFQKAIEISIKEKVDFVLIAGDLFDSAYPPIEILKDTFHVFSKIKDARIPVYIIAGSHDYSVSGKTFLDVLEKAGFCINVHNQEIKDDIIYLNPVIHENIAIYGYPGRKSGLEIQDIRKIKLNDSPLFKILMLHTTLKCVARNLPVDSIDESTLPLADYYALGHVHIDFQYDKINYPGPLFPNNFQELADLKNGGFYIVDLNKSKGEQLIRYELNLMGVELIEVNISDAINATDTILSELNQHNMQDKIILLKLKGRIKKGKTSDINFQLIEDEIMKKNAYAYLKNTNDLKSEETTIEVETDQMQDVEEQIIQNFSSENKSKFNNLILPLINALSIEKQEDEKSAIFEKRLMDEVKKITPLLK